MCILVVSNHFILIIMYDILHIKKDQHLPWKLKSKTVVIVISLMDDGNFRGFSEVLILRSLMSKKNWSAMKKLKVCLQIGLSGFSCLHGKTNRFSPVG